MVAKDLISDIVSALNVNETGKIALKWMEVFRVSHLPVVDKGRYVGLISDSDIYDYNNYEDLIKNHHLSLMEAYVTENQHIYDVFDVMARFKLSIVPVLDRKKKFLGLISVFDLMQSMDAVIGMKVKGSIIVLELNSIDYSLSEISQIIESDNKKILSLYLKTIINSKKIQVTIKVNTENITPLLKSFTRYNYNIIFSSSPEEPEDKYLEDRYKSFMRYLDM